MHKTVILFYLLLSFDTQFVGIFYCIFCLIFFRFFYSIFYLQYKILNIGVIRDLNGLWCSTKICVQTVESNGLPSQWIASVAECIYAYLSLCENVCVFVYVCVYVGVCVRICLPSLLGAKEQEADEKNIWFFVSLFLKPYAHVLYVQQLVRLSILFCKKHVVLTQKVCSCYNAATTS